MLQIVMYLFWCCKNLENHNHKRDIAKRLTFPKSPTVTCPTDNKKMVTKLEVPSTWQELCRPMSQTEEMSCLCAFFHPYNLWWISLPLKKKNFVWGCSVSFLSAEFGKGQFLLKTWTVRKSSSLTCLGVMQLSCRKKCKGFFFTYA